MLNFNQKLFIHKKRMMDLIFKFIIILLLFHLYWVIKLALLLYAQSSYYDYLERINKKQTISAKNLLEKNNSPIAKETYQSMIEEQNKRTQFFIWMKQWCDEWFCLGSSNAKWSKLTVQYDPSKHAVTANWNLIYSDISYEYDFSNWMRQSVLLNHASIVSMVPELSSWIVEYTGKKSL